MEDFTAAGQGYPWTGKPDIRREGVWRRSDVSIRVLPRNKEFEVKELREQIGKLERLVDELREINSLLEEENADLKNELAGEEL